MLKRSKRAWLSCAVILAGAPSARADLLTNWNLVTTGDLYAGYSVQGSLRVGGNLYVQNTLEAATMKGSPTASNPGLMVGGNVTTKNANPETIKIMKGNGLVGGTINGAANDNARVLSAQGGGTVKVDASVAKIGAADASELQASSAAFQAMKPGTQGIYIPSGQVDTARFTVLSVDSAGNSVFNVDGEKLFENGLIRGFTLDLNGYTFGAGQSIVFNVSGVDLDFRGGLNYDGAFRTSTGNILWNFYQATDIDLGKGDIAGSILAPSAVLTNANRIDGSVFVKSFGTGYGNGMGADVRTPMYLGYDPSTSSVGSTPEPSGLVMAGVAVAAGLTLAARRRVA